MQTRKLIAGETLLLEEEKGFCLVVDGMVQIFVKSNREEDIDDGPSRKTEGFYDEGEEHLQGTHQGYQLLTEVKNGAPMSSLFSILSLFTEDVRLRHDAEERPSPSPSTAAFVATPVSGADSPDMVKDGPAYHGTRPIYSRASSYVPISGNRELPVVPPLLLDPEGAQYQIKQPNNERTH